MFWRMASTRLNPESSICWKIFNQNFKSSPERPIQAIFHFLEGDIFFQFGASFFFGHFVLKQFVQPLGPI